MLAIFREIFNPTPQQMREQQEKYQKLVNKSHDEKWCCTCKNYIPVDERLSGVITTYPECNLGGLAEETCLFYKADNKL